MYYVGTQQFNSLTDATNYVRANGGTVTSTPSAPLDSASGGMFTSPNRGGTTGVTPLPSVTSPVKGAPIKQAPVVAPLPSVTSPVKGEPIKQAPIAAPAPETPAEMTFTFVEGIETGSGSQDYLYGQEGEVQQLTADQLRDYYEGDNVNRLQEQFGSFDNYLAYMTEREQLIQSGDYSVGNWSEADAGFTEDQEMLLEGDADLTIDPSDPTQNLENIRRQQTGAQSGAYQNWLNSDVNRQLMQRYGIGGDIYSDSGDRFRWNGSAYVKVEDASTGVGQYALAGMAALAGMYAAPAFSGALGGGSLGGAAGGVASSAVSQLIATGSVDPESLAIGAISGAIGAIGDIDPADMSSFEAAIDNAAWDLSGALGVDHATAIRMLQTAGTGVAGGDSLEEVAGNLIADFGADVFMANVDLGIDDIQMENVFGEGTSTIDAEAIEGVLANLAQGEDASTVLREFAQDGGLGFLDPTDLDIDLDLEGDLGFIEDAVRAIGSEIDDEVLQVIREEIPHGTTPDIDLPDVDIDLPDVDIDLPAGPDIDLPEGPSIDTPSIDTPSIDMPSFSLGGGSMIKGGSPHKGGINYALPQGEMILYRPPTANEILTDFTNGLALQRKRGMLV